MGLTVNQKRMVQEFNLELPNFYASLSGQVQVMKHYGAGKDALKPPTYLILANFGVWSSKSARDANARPLTLDRVHAGPFDEAPTGTVYELVYDKYKTKWRYFVDDSN